MVVISRIEPIGGGRVRGGWGGECCAISIGDPDWLNSQGRPGLPLESVWHPMQSY